jgi:hypothetical protein
MSYAKQKIVLGLAGIASSSTGSSLPVFVGDCRLLTLSVQSSNASASRYTVSISNNDGFQSRDSALFFSVVTTILNQGVYTIDPGGRWLQVERPNFGMGSAASNVTVILNRYFE